MGCLALESNLWDLGPRTRGEPPPDLEFVLDMLDRARLLMSRELTAANAHTFLPRVWDDLTIVFGLPALTAMQQNLLQSLVVAVRHLRALPTKAQVDVVRLGVAFLVSDVPVRPSGCVEIRAKLRAVGLAVDELTSELVDLSCNEGDEDE